MSQVTQIDSTPSHKDLNIHSVDIVYIMKNKRFWMYLLFGALIGFIVGFMKKEIALWLVVGSVLGFLVALFFESEFAKRTEPHKLM